jgi:hypothetical protein
MGMDRFEELSLLGNLFPKITRLVLLVGLLFFTHAFTTALTSIAEEYGRHLTREIESAVMPKIHRPGATDIRHHPSGGHTQADTGNGRAHPAPVRP